MNGRLKNAFDLAARLPAADQEAIATLVLEEMRAERAWDEWFAAWSDSPAPRLRRRAPSRSIRRIARTGEVTQERCVLGANATENG